MGVEPNWRNLSRKNCKKLKKPVKKSQVIKRGPKHNTWDGGIWLEIVNFDRPLPTIGARVDL